MEEYLNGRKYQAWLMQVVKMNRHKKLFGILYSTEFTWVHPFDENRAADGVYLRYRFTQDEFSEDNRRHHGHTFQSSMEDIPCSVLEMLIALAINIEDSIMYDPKHGDRTPEWFWMMLENLDLARYDDRFMSSLSKSEYISVYNAIRSILTAFMDRDYGYDGKGGLFPLRRPRMDQREEEIWYQANVYAIEELGL